MSLFRRLWSFSREQPRDPLQMIAVLLDPSNDLGSRDDIAMDLGAFDLAEVEAALVTVASNAAEDEMVVDSAGQSLWQIYKRQNRTIAADVFAGLQPSARKFFQTPDV